MIIAIIIFCVVLVILLAIFTYGSGLEMFIDAGPKPYFWPNVEINRFRKLYTAPCDKCLVRDNCGIYNTKPVMLLNQIEECNKFDA